MSVIDAHGSSLAPLATTYYEKWTNRRCQPLTPAELQAVYAHIGVIYDNALTRNPPRFNVTRSVPSDWQATPLQVLFERACAYDHRDAALLLGNLVCRVGISRRETWWSFRDWSGGPHHPTSRTYLCV